ncbi:hypothetical protein [Persephonella sp.]
MKIFYAKKMSEPAKFTTGNYLTAAGLKDEGYYVIIADKDCPEVKGTLKDVEKALKSKKIPYEKKSRLTQRIGKKLFV